MFTHTSDSNKSTTSGVLVFDLLEALLFLLSRSSMLLGRRDVSISLGRLAEITLKIVHVAKQGNGSSELLFLMSKRVYNRIKLTFLLYFK